MKPFICLLLNYLPVLLLPQLASCAVIPAEEESTYSSSDIPSLTPSKGKHGGGRHKIPKPKYCVLVSSVTYYNQWGPQFIENDYECNLPPLQPQTTDPSEAPPFLADGPSRKPARPTAQSPLIRGASSDPPQGKHQITNYGCLTLPHANPLDQTKGASLLYSMTQLSNQSCIPPGHMREYIEVPRSWSADWAFSNLNRGNETICDWYTELANVAQALHFYCEHSLERKLTDGGALTEAVGYGRDKERAGSQVWCMRYTTRGWGEEEFERKCLAIGEEEEWGKVDPEGHQKWYELEEKEDREEEAKDKVLWDEL